MQGSTAHNFPNVLAPLPLLDWPLPTRPWDWLYQPTLGVTKQKARASIWQVARTPRSESKMALYLTPKAGSKVQKGSPPLSCGQVRTRLSISLHRRPSGDSLALTLCLHAPPRLPRQSPYLLQLLLSLQNVPFHLVSVRLHAGDEQSQFLGCSPGRLSGQRTVMEKPLSHTPIPHPAMEGGPTPPTPPPAFYREESVV